jgi:hypothetical protein
MMTQSEQEAFFKFKMKPVPLTIKVMAARGDYSAPQPIQTPRPEFIVSAMGDMVFDGDDGYEELLTSRRARNQ